MSDSGMSTNPCNKSDYHHKVKELTRQLDLEQKSVNELSLHAQDLAQELSEAKAHNAEWIERCRKFRKQDADEAEWRLAAARNEIAELENAAILTYQQFQIKIDALENESESLRANCDAQQKSIEHLTLQLEAALKQLAEAREEIARLKSLPRPHRYFCIESD